MDYLPTFPIHRIHVIDDLPTWKVKNMATWTMGNGLVNNPVAWILWVCSHGLVLSDFRWKADTSNDDILQVSPGWTICSFFWLMESFWSSQTHRFLLWISRRCDLKMIFYAIKDELDNSTILLVVVVLSYFLVKETFFSPSGKLAGIPPEEKENQSTQECISIEEKALSNPWSCKKKRPSSGESITKWWWLFPRNPTQNAWTNKIQVGGSVICPWLRDDIMRSWNKTDEK